MKCTKMAENEDDMLIFIKRRNGTASAVDIPQSSSLAATFEITSDAGIVITGKDGRRIDVRMEYHKETDDADGETGNAFDACRKYAESVPGFLTAFVRSMPEQSKRAFGYMAMLYKIDTDNPGHVLLIIRCIRDCYPELVSAYKRTLVSACPDTFLSVHASACKAIGCSHVGPGIPKWGFPRHTEIHILADMILHLYCNGAFGCCPADLHDCEYKNLVAVLKQWQVPRFIRDSGISHGMWNMAIPEKRSEVFYVFHNNKIGK